MRYFICLGYDGTGYSGWQIQPGALSVQETLEKSLSLFLRHETCVVGAGRTDAGVHASRMVAHFDSDSPLDTEWVKNKLNSILPPDISVWNVVRVRDNAHARFDAVSRTYRYHVTMERTPFGRDYCWILHKAPDFDLMNEASSILLDTVDFTSFSKLHTDTRTNDCHVTEAFWAPDGRNGMAYTITANRFLRNMVRAVVGTLMEVGRHRITVSDFAGIVASRDRCSAGDSAPARGLFLDSIAYPDDIFNVD